MRNVVASLLQLVGVVLAVTAGFLWCVPAGVAVCALVVGGAGYVADPNR